MADRWPMKENDIKDKWTRISSNFKTQRRHISAVKRKCEHLTTQNRLWNTEFSNLVIFKNRTVQWKYFLCLLDSTYKNSTVWKQSRKIWTKMKNLACLKIIQKFLPSQIKITMFKLCLIDYSEADKLIVYIQHKQPSLIIHLI